MTYTVFHQDDAFAPQTGLSLEQAATELLRYDGHEFEVRNEDDAGFALWHTQFSRNGTLGGRPMVRTVIYSVNDDRAKAEAEIFARVISCGYWEPMVAMLDNDYKALQAQIELEAADEDLPDFNLGATDMGTINVSQRELELADKAKAQGNGVGGGWLNEADEAEAEALGIWQHGEFTPYGRDIADRRFDISVK